MNKLGNAGEFSRFKINPELDNYRLAWKLEIQLIKFKYQSLTRGIYRVIYIYSFTITSYNIHEEYEHGTEYVYSSEPPF